MTIEERIHEALHEYADTIEPEPDSWEQITARVDDGQALHPPSRGRMLVFASLAVMTVVVLVGVLLVRDTNDSSDRDRVVTAPRAPATSGMPARIIAVNESGQPVVLDSATGEQEDAFETSGVAAGVQIAAAPDGRHIYLVRGDGNQGCSDHTLVRLPLADGGGTAQLVSSNATDPTVSPDGRYLAYLHCSPEAGNRADHIVLLSLATGQEQVTSAPPGTYFSGRLEFAPDSNHVVFNLTDADGAATSREIAVADGEAPPGRQIALVGGGGTGWRAMRGQTGDYLGVLGSSPARVVVFRGPAPFQMGAWFSLPAVPSQVVSDASGDHVLAVVDGVLYRWSEGEKGAKKIADGVIGAAWIPDLPEAPKPTAATDEPNGVLVAFGGERLAVLGAQDGQQHSSLGTFPGLSAVSATRDGRTVLFGAARPEPVCDFEAPKTPPVLERLNTVSGERRQMVGGAYSAVVSAKDLAAYGYSCDGNGLGLTDVTSGKNFRTDALGGTETETDARIEAVYPLGWAPDATRLLYRVQLAGDANPHYYVGRLWPAVPQAKTEVIEIPNGDGSITAAAFVDDETVMIARRQGDRNTLHEVDMSFLAESARKGPDWDRSGLLTTGGFPAPGQVTSLVSDRSGQHFLVITNDRTLYRWVRGDAEATKLAADVTSATWLPWS